MDTKSTRAGGSIPHKHTDVYQYNIMECMQCTWGHCPFPLYDTEAGIHSLISGPNVTDTLIQVY